MADGGTQSGRHLYQSESEIQLPGKLHISSNFMLHFSAQDQAIRDRLVVIRYHRRFVADPSMENESHSNPSVVSAIREDPDAIGTWMAIGAQKALQDLDQKGKIQLPAIIRTETEAEINKIDVIHSFITKYTEMHSRVLGVKAGTSYLRCISKKDWVYNKNHCFHDFAKYAQSSGCVTKWDMPMFNTCLERYFESRAIGVVTLCQDQEFFWHGVRPTAGIEE
jgi:phage/plasmid-associated DNA primase